MIDIPDTQWQMIVEAAQIAGAPPGTYRTTAERLLAGVKEQSRRIAELEDYIRQRGPGEGEVWLATVHR